MRWRFSSFAQYELCSSLLAYTGDFCSLRLTHKITALSYVVCPSRLVGDPPLHVLERQKPLNG